MIIGKNICIRPLESGDEEILHRWWNDGEIMAHAGFPHGTLQGIESIREIVRRESAQEALFPTSKILMLCRRHDMSPIGEVSYGGYDRHNQRCEIGIKICDFTAREKGFGTEALALFIDYLFMYLNLNKIELTTMPDNSRAHHVYAKLGFKRSGVMRGHYFDARSGHFIDSVYMDLLKKEWMKKRPAYLS